MNDDSAEDLFSVPGRNVLVVGVGTVGGRVAAAGALDDACAEAPERVLWYALHSDPAELIATGLDKKLLVTLAPGPFAARSAAGGVAVHKAELAAACAGRSAALLVGVLGEDVVTAVLPLLARALRENGLSVCVILTGPLWSEAPAQSDDIRAALEQVEKEAELVIRFPTEALVGAFLDGSATVLCAEVKSRLLAAAQALSGALRGGTGNSVPLRALRDGMPGAGPLSAGLGIAAGPHAARLALEAAQSSVAGAGPVTGAGAVLLTKRELTVAEAKSARQCLEQAWTGRKAPLLALATRSTLDDEAVCVVVVRVSRPRPSFRCAEIPHLT
ncbi:MAG: hypothetical protein NTW87_32495 [Planctomycetota bacterium]|nr:hypothetical protein [Planctomycetota bacterium]